jgi:hypothetical protein
VSESARGIDREERERERERIERGEMVCVREGAIQKQRDREKESDRQTDKPSGREGGREERKRDVTRAREQAVLI